jgi:hypothetical protein
MLAGGDVKVVSGNKAQDIAFKDALTWGSTTRLTLDAYRSIEINAPIAVAGTGALTITTNDGGSNGDFFFAKQGHIEFWDLNSHLKIGDSGYTLVRSIKALAHAIAKNPSGLFALARRVEAERLGAFSSSPIQTPFAGTLEGLGNAISDLTISAGSNEQAVGLFSELSSGGVLRDLSLERANVTVAQADEVGALVGESSHASLLAVSADASVSVGGFASGEYGVLVGANFNGAIDRSSSSGSVIGRNGVGGLAGENYDGMITNSHSGASVSSAFAEVGGLVGDNYADDGESGISNCYATGTVTTTGATSAGGLVGFNEAWVKSSYATGAVSAADGATVGGLVGSSEVDGIENSYATGSVSGGANSKAGGLVGFDVQTAAYSYSTGAVTAGSNSYVGGVIGYLNFDGGYVGNLYWDLDTSGISDTSDGCGNPSSCQGVTGLTDAQLKSGLPAGFDTSVWGQSASINDGYPYLLANPPPK